MKKFRWGVIGTGMIAKVVCKEIVKSGRHEIAAVYSRTYERAHKFAKKYGAKCYSDLEEMLSDKDVDAVYIATPHSVHYSNLIACINAGKPAFAEKAFTVNAAQAERVFTLAKEKKVLVCEAMWTRFQPVVLEVAETVERGEIGEIKSFRGGFSTPATWVKPFLSDRLFKPEYAGGALLDVGVYPISFSHMLLGVPDVVECRAKLENGIDMNDDILLKYACGAVCSLTCTLEGLKSFTGVIEGENGKIIIPNYSRPKKATVYGEDGSVKRVIKGNKGYIYEFDAFADSVRRGETECVFMTGKDTVEVMNIMDECRKKTGLSYPENIERL